MGREKVIKSAVEWFPPWPLSLAEELSPSLRWGGELVGRGMEHHGFQQEETFL